MCSVPHAAFAIFEVDRERCREKHMPYAACRHDQGQVARLCLFHLSAPEFLSGIGWTLSVNYKLQPYIIKNNKNGHVFPTI